MISTRHRVFWLATMTSLLAGCAADMASLPEEDLSDLPAIGGKGDWISDRPEADALKRWRGQSDFLSTAPAWDYGPIALGTSRSAAAEGAGAPNRTVEEADVYRYDEAKDVLYVLNAYRGLQVIDLHDVDHPRLLSRADLNGYPIDMYQRGDQAYVLLNSMDEQDTGNYWGAVLRVYDLSNELSPVQTAQFRVPGSVVGSRLLATDDGSSAVIYVASQVYTQGTLENGTTWSPHTHIQSIDVTDPFTPKEVDAAEFPGSGSNVHVTPETFFVSQYSWAEGTSSTKIRFVDISDRRGDIEVMGETEVEGTLSWGDRGELQMSYASGFLRVASQIQRWTTGENARFETNIRLSAIDVHDGNHMTVADTLDVAQGERLLATRFTDKLAYLFHAVQRDPLEIIDFSNPADIRSLSILPIPGLVNHIEARGDRLLTLGQFDDETRKLAIIMFDVANPAAPRELSRASTGENWAWTSASYDLKTFRVLDEQGLVLLPVSESKTVDGRYEYRQWLQLFSFDLVAGTVQARGQVENIDGVQRAFPAHERLVAFSDRELQVVNAANPDMPALTGSLELARDVQDFETASGFGMMLVGTGSWYSPKAELRVVSLHNPDESAPLATLAMDVPAGELTKLDEETLAIVGTDNQGATIITVLDVGDPLAPAMLGTFKSAELGFNRWGRGMIWRPAPSVDHVFVGDALAMYTFANDAEHPGAKLRVVSLANRAFPHESASVDLGEGTVVGMRAVGTTLYVSSYVPVASAEPVEPTAPVGTADPASPTATAASLLPGGTIRPWRPRSQTVRYQLRTIDLSNPDRPVVSSPIAVPGAFAGLSTIDGYTVLYTTDSTTWDGVAVNAFDTMVLGRGKARLLDVFGLHTGESVFVQGEAAFFTPVVQYETNEAGEAIVPPTTTVLQALDMSRPDTVRAAGRVEVPTNQNSWRSLASVEGDLAFVNSGYGKLQAYDVSNVDNLTLLDTFSVSRGWWNGRLHLARDGRLYLPGGMYGLQVINVR